MFKNGRAIVQLSEDTQHVIDTRGQTLFVVPSGFYMDHNYSGSGFIMYDNIGNSMPALLTEDFAPVILPESARTTNNIEHVRGDWYSCRLDSGTILFNHEREYFLPDVHYISHLDMENELIVFAGYSDNGTLTGVRTLDGRDIIPADRNVTITVVADEDRAIAFVVNSHNTFLFPAWEDPEFRQSIYRLVDTDGSVIISGYGVLNYNEQEGLYSVLGADHFSWLSKDGSVIISIPHMSSMLD